MNPLPQGTTRLGINIVLLLAGVVALRLGQSVIIPLIIAMLLAAVLGPAASWLHRVLRFSWPMACLTVICGLVLVNLLLILVFTVAATRMVQQLPSGNQEIFQFYEKFRANLEQAWPWPLDHELFPVNPENIDQIRAYQYVTEAGRKFLPILAEYGSSWLWQWIIILFTLLFLLLEGRMLTRRVVEIFGPSAEIRAKAGEVLGDIARSVRTYLVWRTIINFGLAVVVGVVYQFAGLRQAWTWAILLAILNYIPYLGPILAGIPPFMDAFLFTDPVHTLVIVILYSVIIILEGYLIVPLLIGRSMELNATTVMVACLFWELVWGMVGLFLAMPIMAGVKAICMHVPGWRPWANLMGIDHGDMKVEASAAADDPSLLMEEVSARNPAGP
ncbi:MAG TPA: AI-2E family transporter [Gemmataceae bacterium]|jgi:AI-2 transport protein TqsA|nr:AI-2E family transporter [Gemmataceae bacterium]